MSPADLAKVAAKYGVSKDVARLSLDSGTGGTITKTEQTEVSVRSHSSKRLRQNTKPLMNKLESAWFEVLKIDCPKARPQVAQFRLGNGIQYRPDFIDFSSIPVTAWEVKGPHSFRGGFENLKVAAALYPEIRWILVWKESGNWQEQVVLP